MFHSTALHRREADEASQTPIAFSPVKSSVALRLFGLKMMNGSRADAVDMIVLRALMHTPTQVSFVNAHCINMATRHPDYAETLAGADLILPDGAGMRIAARLARQPMGENLNGTDLFPELCAKAAFAGLPVFLLGGRPGVAAAATAAMRSRYPALRIAGTEHGFFAPEQTEAVIAAINASGAAILFVGFGVPQQETWIARHAAKLDVPVLLGVGGLFDYFSGRIPRAPQAIRRIGCEWAWRLAQEPRRLARRYLIGNAAFLWRAAVHGVRARGHIETVRTGAKRAIDIAVAVCGLIALSPILLAAALAIKLEDGGPVLFRQTRIGKHGKPFAMAKFRSMVADAERQRSPLLSLSERDGTCFKMRRDPRLTTVGRILRRCSIDELPQLINVLSGEMSLVGPRPALPSEVVTYRDASWLRLGGKPGITCIWQVSGRAEIPFEQQVAMDIAYLDRPSLRIDLALLARTIPAVVGGRGAY